MRQTLTALVGSVAGAFLLSATPAGAVSYQLTHTFTPDNPAYASSFGSALAFEDGVVAIKSESGYIDLDGTSVTHVFEQDVSGNWAEAATLDFDSGADRGKPFSGQELAIDDGEIVIGFALDYEDASTSQLQFATRDQNGWTASFNEPTHVELDRIVFGVPIYRSIFEPVGRDGVGRSVDISGSYAIAEDRYGPDFSRNNLNGGLARIYKRSEAGLWTETANLFPTDTTLNFQAGSVALDGTTAVVANWGSGSFFVGPRVHVFERNEAGDWYEHSVLPVSADFATVEIDGDIIVAQDIRTDGIEVFQRKSAGWESVFSLADLDMAGGLFVDNGLIAYARQMTDVEAGRIEVLHQDAAGDWEVFATVTDPNPDGTVAFGRELALDGSRLLVGSRTPEDNGVVYLFEPVPEPASVAILTLLGVAGLCRRRRA